MKKQRKKGISKLLHLSQAERFIFKKHEAIQDKQPQQIMKEAIFPVYKIRQSLPISGQTTKKYQHIRENLKKSRNKILQQQQEPVLPTNQKTDSPSSRYKQLPLFLRHNKDPDPIKSADKLKQDYQSHSLEKRVKEFVHLINLKKEFKNKEEMVFDPQPKFKKQEAKVQAQDMKDQGRYDQELLGNMLRHSMLIKKKQHIRNRLAYSSQQKRINTSPRREVQSSILSAFQNKRIQNSLSPVNSPRVIDSSQPIIIQTAKKERRQRQRRLSVSIQEQITIVPEHQSFVRFKSEHPVIVEKVRALLQKRSKISLFDKLSPKYRKEQ